MTLFRVGSLPSDALAASAQFHQRILPAVSEAVAAASDQVTLVFEPADHTHRGWRLAVVQGLAREYAPKRVNALASDDQAAIAAAEEYCVRAPGVTGQYLPLDSNGAGEVLYPDR